MKKLYDCKILDELKVYLHIYDKEVDQTEQEYLQVVALAASKADDQVWKLLSKEAQGWANDANNILERNQRSGSTDLLPIPGFTSKSSRESISRNSYGFLGASRHKAHSNRKKYKAGNANKRVKHEANSYYITKFTKALKTRVVELTCENPGITYQEVIVMLQREQFTFSAEVVRAQYDCVKLVFRTLQALDKLSEEY